MQTLGTILPTRKSLAADKREYAAQQVRMEKVRCTSPELKGLERRKVGMEVRFYNGENQYAIVAQRGTHAILWFHRRADGYWYSGKTKAK
jgi:hypothetical protein